MHIKMIAFAVAVTFSAAPAVAADAALQEPVYPQQGQTYSAYDWSGLYLGLQGGYSWTQVGYLRDAEQDLDGGSFGAHAGYNFQHGNIVFGAENDINYNWNDSREVGLEWDGSLRGRLGYAWDRTLFYGTAGVAAAGGDINVDGVGKKNDILIGWTAGGGVEHALTDSISTRAEYRYTDFGSVDFGSALGEFKADQNKVSLGASFRF